MSKRNLTAVYTAPRDLLEADIVDDVPEQEITENTYKARKFARAAALPEKDYKSRLAEAIRQEKERRDINKPSTDEDDSLKGKDAPELQAGSQNPENLSLQSREMVFVQQNKAATENTKLSSRIVLDDAMLDIILPPGYVKAEIQTSSVGLYEIPTAAIVAHDALPEYDGIVLTKEDVKHFPLLVAAINGESVQDGPHFQAQSLLLRAKNGAPPARKKAMRAISTAANSLAPHIFTAALPLLLEAGILDTDRHLLTKAIARTAAHSPQSVSPHVRAILTAIGPQLLDEDTSLRLESRDLVGLVCRAAGVAPIVAALRPDLASGDEYVRNITSRIFAVAAAALGLQKLLPFLKAVVRLKSWAARHTGVRIINHFSVDVNASQISPFLAEIVSFLSPCLNDEMVQVRTASANTLAQLATSVSPFGIENFELALEITWGGLKQHRGRPLAAFMRCMASMIPLMAHDAAWLDHTTFYTRELVLVVSREFSLPDDEMRRTVLRAVALVPMLQALFPDWESKIVSPFFKAFWTRRTASDSYQVSRLVVDATFSVASTFSVSRVILGLLIAAKDANDSLRGMACEAIHRILLSVPDVIVELDRAGDERLVDAVLFAFQEQPVDQPQPATLQAVLVVCKVLGSRLAPHIPVILLTVLFRLKNSEPVVREQAADLVAAVAPSLRECLPTDDAVLPKLVLFLYEGLGEVYPEVLGLVVGALHACLDTFDAASLSALENPSVNILLPTLTPILKNRHEKVQEQCLKVVGLIAQRSAETINAKEWMRICFDLLDMLKAQRKRIRVAATSTFGHIANTIGPLDVLAMLLNNLRMQERQLRVSTAVAIGIVADTCAPFTVLPALMNEYSVPDKNVQNSVLKALTFLFEYIEGSTTSDYLFAITPLVEDALTDRDQVHRQTAASVVKHLALKCYGRANDDLQDVFVHFLNLVLPNIYELLPHVIARVLEALDALRLVVGNGIFFNYVWAGLFHAARKVRVPYWKLYDAAYAQCADSMVPVYPLGEVDELDIWL